MVMTDAENNKAANRMLYIFMAAGIFPLLVIFSVYLSNSGSPLLNDIATKTMGLPAITSLTNPIMTKVMDVYCKTAPILALILFLFSYKKRKLIRPYKYSSLIRSCLLGPIFYFIYIYLILCRNIELTAAGRPAKLMADNDFTLFVFYSGLYLSIFIMTYFILLIPVISYQLLKERR